MPHFYRTITFVFVLLADLITFRRLEILDLRHNKLAGSIPPDIVKLSSLEVLYLSSNELNGSLPDPGKS